MKPKIFHKLIHILQSILAIPHQQQLNLMTHIENHMGLKHLTNLTKSHDVIC